MLIAVCVIVCLLLLFVLLSFFLTYKTYEFNIDDKKLKVQNIASHLKIFIDGALIADYFAPKLIQGESYKLKIGDRDVELKCKSSALGYRLSVQIYEGDVKIADNGVRLKTKKAK